MVSAGDYEGYIFLWLENKIIKKHPAHSKNSVLCLSSLPDSKTFISGGQDGRVILWRLNRSWDGPNVEIERVS